MNAVNVDNPWWHDDCWYCEMSDISHRTAWVNATGHAFKLPTGRWIGLHAFEQKRDDDNDITCWEIVVSGVRYVILND